MDDGWVERVAGELRTASTVESRAEVCERIELTEDQGRRLDALNFVQSIGLGDLEGASAVTAWYETRDECLLPLGEVALVAAKFVREVGSRWKGPEIGGYL
jgi:hypothetical protein